MPEEQEGGRNMSDAGHQLLITLVHGTWGRGFFPGRQRRNRRPLWFEEGSPFLARLSGELGDIRHKITPLLWSGANSIFVRNKTAQVLAEHLSAEHGEHPKATQLVIAHSHGGNIALRALHHLRQPDASRSCGTQSANPLVVTLATPFVEVQHADFGRRPYLIRLAVIFAILMPLLILEKRILRAIVPDPLERSLPIDINLAVTFILCGFIWWYWLSQRATAKRKDQVEALREATRLGEIVSAQAQRLLIIRAIDDEATLSLALGTIANYVTTRAITYFWIALILSVQPALFLLYSSLEMSFLEQEWYQDAGYLACSALILFLIGALMSARMFHGSELARSPMELQINTQSAPDAKGLSEIVTLVRRTHAKSLRHGIYGHEDCAKTIADWVHSQLPDRL
jgi:hypothetical protein